MKKIEEVKGNDVMMLTHTDDFSAFKSFNNANTILTGRKN